MAKEAVNVNELSALFTDVMEEKGFSTYFHNDKWQPRIICNKKNHYQFEMVIFLTPSSSLRDNSISISAYRGTELHSIMYYQLKNVSSEDTFERFARLMEEAEKYIETEIIEPKEDRRVF